MKHCHTPTNRTILFFLSINFLLVSISSCQKDNTPLPDDEHQIISFTFRKADGTVIDTALISGTF
ncbi:MAG: hypothetical protein ABWZ25_17070 [Chitinophagaceae bacterium]